MIKHFTKWKTLNIGLVAAITTAASLICSGQVYAAHGEDANKTYTVSQDGSGDFITIQEGVDSVKDGDTLIINPGIYTENVVIMNKTVNLKGVNCNSCFLRYDTESYHNVPLTVGAGEISNLTIYGMSADTALNNSEPDDPGLITITPMDVPADTESVKAWQDNYSGYAVHVDQDYSYGKGISFRNCKIISENNQCVGMGCRPDSTVIFENCELKAGGNGGCIFLHDTKSDEIKGKTAFKIINSTLESRLSPYVMTIHAMSDENRIDLTFQNVKVKAVAYENAAAYTDINMNTGYDVDTIATLDRLGATGSDSELVHVLSMQESKDYMINIENKSRYYFWTPLAEGITYVVTNESTMNSYKKYTISVYNRSGMPGEGWCGLSNTFLTSDSYGNTLMEMNYTY